MIAHSGVHSESSMKRLADQGPLHPLADGSGACCARSADVALVFIPKSCLFRLETVDGAPAEPPTFATGVPKWSPGDVIPLGHRALRVIGKRDDDPDQPPVLIVEEAF